MPWDRNVETAAKYRTPEHRNYRASLVAQLKREGYLLCTADVCVLPSRIITNPNGRARDGLHAGHEDNGVDYRGPQHNACNVRDGAVRASARSHGLAPSSKPDRWVL